MITHSPQFLFAMGIAYLEYFVEWYFYPSLKGHPGLYITAFMIAVFGISIRIVAMYTAGVSFHHHVQVLFLLKKIIFFIDV